MKKIVLKPFLLLCAVSVLTAALPQSIAASRIGEAVGYALYTDIVAYIDKQPIRSFNINGYTAVAVEDLACYGFSVAWDSSARSLSASRSALTEAGIPPYKPDGVSKDMVGKRAASVLYTDIKCFFDGKQIDSFNIGGKTIVYVDILAEMYAGSYVWDAEKRTLNLDLSAPGAEPGHNQGNSPGPESPPLSVEDSISEIVNLNQPYSTFYQIERYDCRDYTVVFGGYGGLPHGGYSVLWIVYQNGRRQEILESLPQTPYSWQNSFDIYDMKLSQDEKTLTFTRLYEDKEIKYTVDLPTAKLTEAG